VLPNYGDKYDADAIYTPEQSVAAAGLPDLPAAVVLGFDARLREAAEGRGEPIDPDPARELEFYRLDQSVAFVPVETVGVGAPAAAVAAEKAIAAGADALVVAGGCGCLQPDLGPDTVLLPTAAIRDEGASYHYLPGGDPVEATPGLVDALADAFGTAGVDTARGPTWTTSALYRETLPEIDHYRREGALSVGMESAAVWAVCRYRDVDAATVHHVDSYLDPGDPAAGGERELAALLDPAVRGLSSYVGGR
jgi:uridine phosphorylase